MCDIETTQQRLTDSERVFLRCLPACTSNVRSSPETKSLVGTPAPPHQWAKQRPFLVCGQALVLAE
jgi:hypothetical protein